MAEHGGHRTPAHPAAASGPGALSQRTDGGPATQGQMLASGGAYGDRKAMTEIQGGAPMQGTAPAPGAPGGGPTAEMLPNLADPTGRPDEPVTAGADAGAGIGSQAAGIFSDEQQTMEQVAPMMRSLELIANLPGSTPETRAFVRRLKARVNG